MRQVEDMSIRQFALDMIEHSAAMPVGFDMREQLQRTATRLHLLCSEYAQRGGAARISSGESAVACCSETIGYFSVCRADRSLIMLVDFFSYRIRNGIAAERKLLKFAAHRKKGSRD